MWKKRQCGVRQVVISAAICLLSVVMGCGGGELGFPTEYQAVFLDNGQVFFGKIEETSSPYITLRDVFYVQSVTDRDKKETKNILLKRGYEWHGPAFMRLNPRHVVLIEPVGPDSRVAQLIREARSAPPPRADGPPAAAPAPKPAGSSGLPASRMETPSPSQERDKKPKPAGR